MWVAGQLFAVPFEPPVAAEIKNSRGCANQESQKSPILNVMATNIRRYLFETLSRHGRGRAISKKNRCVREAQLQHVQCGSRHMIPTGHTVFGGREFEPGHLPPWDRMLGPVAPAMSLFEGHSLHCRGQNRLLQSSEPHRNDVSSHRRQRPGQPELWPGRTANLLSH